MSRQPDSRAAPRPPPRSPRRRILIAVLILAGAFVFVAGTMLLSIVVMQ
jgi:hypothetical protein